MTSAVAASRVQLLHAGFAPLPLSGKRPAFEKWSLHFQTNRDEIDLWDKVYPFANNTGILTRLTPTLDIDITDADAAKAVEDLARERFEERGWFLVRIGKPPKRAIPLRTDRPFPKIVRNITAPNGGEHKIELLCDGQQVVCFGDHPETLQPYTWHGGRPGTIRHEELPYVSRDEAAQFVDDAVALLVQQFAFKIGSNRPAQAERAPAGGAGHADWAWLVGNINTGRELHDSSVVLASKLITSGMGDGAAVNMLRGLFEASGAPHDARWRERYDEIPRDVESARDKFGGTTQQQTNGRDETPQKPIQWMNMSAWDEEPRPMRLWAILNRVPLNQAGLFSGEGGAGKSIIEMMKDIAHVAGKDWLGSMPEQGSAFYIGAEDDETEIHIRLYDIAQHYGVTFKDLIKQGLYVMCLLGQDATLCATSGKSGRVETTHLYRQIYEAAGDIKPKNISIDTLSRAFGGNEIDRVQVYAFAMHMQALAKVATGSVTVLSHPSLSGISSGSGISGSTAWHGAFRFRQYLKGVKAEEGEPPAGNLREFEFKKNQYGPIGETIALQYDRGLFLPVQGISSLERAHREMQAETVSLHQFGKDDMNLSNSPNSTNYAPRIMARMLDAKKEGLTEKDLEAAMQRLLATGKIRVERYGRPSEPRFRIVVVG